MAPTTTLQARDTDTPKPAVIIGIVVGVVVFLVLIVIACLCRGGKKLGALWKGKNKKKQKKGKGYDKFDQEFDAGEDHEHGTSTMQLVANAVGTNIGAAL
jgi:hypothetical protein